MATKNLGTSSVPVSDNEDEDAPPVDRVREKEAERPKTGDKTGKGREAAKEKDHPKERYGVFHHILSL